MPGSMRKVKGTLHWVSARHCINAEARLYDRLFNVENASEVKDRDFHELLNPDSLKVVSNIKIEPFLAENAIAGKHFQFKESVISLRIKKILDPTNWYSTGLSL